MKALLLLLLLLCAASCTSDSARNSNNSQAATAQPSPSASAGHSGGIAAPFSNEDNYELSENLEVVRQDARREAIEYARQNFPGWKVKGVISRRTFDKHYQVTLDLEKGSQTKTVQLLLRLFFPEEGDPYWKVEPFVAQNLSRQYQELAYLRFIEGQEYSYDGCRELVLDNLEVDDVPDSVRDAIIESHQDSDDEYEPPDPQ